MDDEMNDSISISFVSSISETFIITWLDSNIDDSSEDTKNVISQLQNNVDCVKIFNNADQCFNFLHDTKDSICLIISDSFDENLTFFLNLIEEMTQIYSVYIISSHQTKFEQYKKVKGVFGQIESIYDALKQNVQQRTNNSSSAKDDATNLDVLDTSYMYSKLLTDILVKIKYNEEAKKTFVSFCREQYPDSNFHLRTINEFEQTYENYSPIWWYTKDTFIYSSLGRALRVLDIDVMINMGFFIRDLHQEIERLHSADQPTTKMIVYRGQGISDGDFEKLKKRKGDLLSFNNFLSTCADREVSVMFADSARTNPDLIGVLFRIEVDPSISSTPFARIDNISYFGGEAAGEVLFSMHTVFRIVEIQSIDDRLWQVDLTLTNDTDPQVKRLTDSIRNEIGDGNIWHSLALLLNKMGHAEKALEIHNKLLVTISNENNDKSTTSQATNYSNIGLIHQSLGDYSTAMDYYQKALEIDQNTLPLDHPSLGTTYNNIAGIHQSLEDYATALSFYEKALEIKEKTLSPNHPSLATICNNIGEVYSSMGEYSKALAFYDRTQEIQKKSLPHRHPSFAITFNNIGLVHRSLGNYSIALVAYERTLDIELHSLPCNHPSLAITYNNIGLLHSFLKNHSMALSFYEKALEINQKSLSPNHLYLATIYNNMGEVQDSMGNYTLALSYYEKTLQILQNSLPVNHSKLAAVYNNIGEVFRSEGNYLTALSYYEKTLEIEQKSFATNHPSLAITYTNIAVALDDLQRYKEAIEYIERAVEIVRHNFGATHSKTKETEDYLNKLREKL